MMLGASARNGESSNLADLSKEDLAKINVSGNGHLRIDQEGHSDSLKWIRHGLIGPRVLGPGLARVGLTAPKEGGGEFEATVNSWTWMAPGVSGEDVGRLTGPVQFVWKLMEFWRLDKRDAVCLLGYDSGEFEYVAAILDGRRRLGGRDVRDRVAHLFHIRRTLWSLFRDLEVENDWLREERSMLNGDSPLSLMLEGSMENLLLAREYVDSAAGVR